MKAKHKYPIWLILTSLVTLLIFLAIFNFKYPTEYNNLGGDNIWQSASTIKYVNIWLQEGAAKMHFTACEEYNSIEYNSIYDRIPFLSYPSGHVFMVWLFAILSGRSEIDISFVKHIQMVLFAIEAMLFAGFVDLLMYNKGIKKGMSRLFVGASTATLWMLFPVDAWYLPNVFFTDQSVLLYVMLFVFLEEALSVSDVTDIAPLSAVLKCLRFLTIVLGMLTDYYFWILVFFVFLFRTAGEAISSKNTGNALRKGITYVLPVVLSLIIFYIQLQFTDGWLDRLLYKFRFRTGGNDSLSELVSRLIINFSAGFTQEQRSFMLYLWLFQLAVFVLALITFKKFKKDKKLMEDSEAALLAAIFIATPFQILMLKNHSAIHEFSMMKAGFLIAMTPVIGALAISKALDKESRPIDDVRISFLGKDVSPLIPSYLICFFILVIITGVPTSTSRYIVSRDGHEDYTVDYFIRDNTGYEDVIFTFTHEIPLEPPMEETIAHKRAYLITDVADIDELFPELNPAAHKLLLIEDNYEDKSPEISKKEKELINSSTLRAKIEGYTLIELQ